MSWVSREPDRKLEGEMLLSRFAFSRRWISRAHGESDSSTTPLCRERYMAALWSCLSFESKA